jgi:hypothetical protein
MFSHRTGSKLQEYPVACLLTWFPPSKTIENQHLKYAVAHAQQAVAYSYLAGFYIQMVPSGAF